MAASNCSLCHDKVETVNHLFFECSFTYHVWSACLDWLGIGSALPNSCQSHFLLFESWWVVRQEIVCGDLFG